MQRLQEDFQRKNCVPSDQQTGEMWKVEILILLFVALAGATAVEEDWTEILKRMDAAYAVEPKSYMVVIFKNEKPICSGTLVGRTTKYEWVVTAAHCVVGSSASSFQVQMGSANLTTPKLVKSFYVHPYYTPPSDYDVALLKTEKFENTSGNNTFEGSNEPDQPPKELTLSPSQPLSKDQVVTNGWDTKGDNKTLVPLEVKIENKQLCKKRLEGYISITSKMLCVTIPKEFENFILGGSPLIFKDKLAGVATAVLHKDPKVLTRIYTNIANSEILDYLNFVLGN